MSNLNVALYLRKSRADLELEAKGGEETLARHRRALEDVARRDGHHIGGVYQEVVSGETISSRPQMQRLLRDIEQGAWDGVLVMEVERLARGDTMDQGIVAQTFQYSGTLIITPAKVYDPNNPFDEEYFEFGLYMSRREYKTTNRRLMAGRLASVKEGKYVGNRPPYGYQRQKLERQKGFTLVPDPEQAPVVRLIFQLSAYGTEDCGGPPQPLGSVKIAGMLDRLGIPTVSGQPNWSYNTVLGILHNQAYLGKIRWNGRPTIKRMVDGQLQLSRPRSRGQEITCDGLHQPLVDQETWDIIQRRCRRDGPPPVGGKSSIQNPLAGLIFCGKCGRSMVRRPYGRRGTPDTLLCPTPHCGNVSARLSLVEEAVVSALEHWLGDSTIHLAQAQPPKKQPDGQALRRREADSARRELDGLEAQQSRAFDLLEQGVYDTATFAQRSRLLAEKTAWARARLAALEAEPAALGPEGRGGRSEPPTHVEFGQVYRGARSPADRNALLRAVLDKVLYIKETGGRGKEGAFQLFLYPKPF